MPAIYHQVVPDVDALQFSDPTTNSRGSNSVYVNFNGSKISLQGVEVDGEVFSTPFGVTCFDDETQERRNLDLSIHCPKALAFFQAVDEKVIQTAIKHRETWFRVPQSAEQIRRNYTPLVVIDQSGKNYPPRLHTKVNWRDDKTKTSEDGKSRSNLLRVFNYDPLLNTYSPANPQDIVSRSRGVPIIDFGSIYFMGATKFGLTLYTSDFLLFPSIMRGPMDHSFPSKALPKLDGKPIDARRSLKLPNLEDFINLLPELQVSEPCKTVRGSTVVYFNNPEGTPVRFELAAVDPANAFRVPFGIKSYLNEPTPRPSMNIEIQDPKLVELCTRMDDFIVQLAKKNFKKWFKNAAEEDLATMYRPILSNDPASSYSPYINCKVDLRPQMRMPMRLLYLDDVTNELKTLPPVTMESVPPRSAGFPIVTLGGIWFSTGRFGLTLNINDFILTSIGDAGAAGVNAFDFGEKTKPVMMTEQERQDQVDNLREQEAMPELQDPSDNTEFQPSPAKRARI